MIFWICLLVHRTVGNVVLIQYLLCLRHIVVMGNMEKCDKIPYFSSVFLRRALGVDFGSIFHRFWDHFGGPGGSKSSQTAIQKPIKKMCSKKGGRVIPGHPETGGGPLKSINPGVHKPVQGHSNTPLRAARARWRIHSSLYTASYAQ